VTCIRVVCEAEGVWPFQPDHPSRSGWTLPKVERESTSEGETQNVKSRCSDNSHNLCSVRSDGSVDRGRNVACAKSRPGGWDGYLHYASRVRRAVSRAWFWKTIVAYHLLDAGNVIGTFSNISVDEGAFGRFEFGYSRDVHSSGDNPELSPLWNGGFNIVQGKVNIIRENAGKHNWIPAISIGGVERTQVHNVGGVIANVDRNNGDAYVVASKTIVASWLHGISIIATGGVRAPTRSYGVWRGTRQGFKDGYSVLWLSNSRDQVAASSF